MIEQGILTEDDNVELLDGVIFQKVSKNPRYSSSTRATRKALERLAPAGWFVDSQEPITLAASEPEPDLAVIRGDSVGFPNHHPGPGDVGLVVEISDSSLDRDRILKKRIYATAGIPWYWILDLKAVRLEAYSDPRDGAYQKSQAYGLSEAAPLELDGRVIGEIPVRELIR